MPEHADGPSAPMVLPSRNALREFCRAIEAALTLATPATTKTADLSEDQPRPCARSAVRLQTGSCR